MTLLKSVVAGTVLAVAATFGAVSGQAAKIAVVGGSSDADSAAIGIGQANKTKTVSLASFDMNEAGLNRIKDGTQAFAIDQRPYLQGYLAVSLLQSAIDFDTSLPTFPVLTGPGIVDSANIGPTLVGVTKGAR
jgi:simple sugar transport system substrate-binding protein